MGLSQGLFGQQQSDFDAAYMLYSNVPKGSLEAMAYGATRMYNLVPDVTEEAHHGPHRYGIFGLVADGQGIWDNNLIESLALKEDVSPKIKKERIQTFLQNPAAQIYSVASRMSFLCDKYHVTSLENMGEALREFSEIPNNSVLNQYAQDLYAYEVFYQLNKGITVNNIEQKPVYIAAEAWFSPTTYSILSAPTVYIDGENISNGNTMYKAISTNGGMNTNSADYAPALWAASPNYSSRNGTAITAVAIHDIEGSYSGCISWFQNSASQVSAHYVLRSSDGQVTQMVLESNKAWHVGNENPYTIGLEHEGYANQVGWYTAAMYNSSAALVRDICTDNNINPTTCYNGPASSGVNVLSSAIKIKGHQHFPNNSHTDPGINWDWVGYYNLVNQISAVCNPPAGLATANFTPNSGRLSWTAVAGASSYSLHYKVNGAATWTTLSAASAAAFLTGLAANTTYQWEVATVCGASTSAYTAGTNVSTMPSNSNACTGSIMDSGGAGNYSNSENWTYTVAPTNAATVSITFNSFGLEANYDYVYVYNGPTTASPLIGTYTGTTTPGTLNSTGGALTLKFTSDGATVSWGFTANWACTQCTTPAGMASSNVTSSGANLTWAALAGASAYTVQVKPTSSATWTSYTASTNSYTLSGLAASTAYNWQVKSVCGATGSSAFSATQNFSTTASVCNAPVGLTSSLVSTTTAMVSWTAVAGSVGYILEWKTTAGATWTTATVTPTSYNLSGLAASTAYQYRLKNKCSASVSSAYSATGTFTTQASCYDAWEANNTSSTASTLTSGTAKYGKICTTTADIDWFKVVTTATSTITVNLSQLPKDYDMELYVGGAYITGSYNGSTTAETIVRTAQPAGSYYYRVYGATSTEYSTTLDYKILATVTPEIATAIDEASLAWDIVLSPNPVKDVFYLQLTNREELGNMQVSIVNMTGASVFEGKNMLLSADKPLQLSTQNWAEGMYIVVLQNGEHRIAKRFVINRE